MSEQAGGAASEAVVAREPPSLAEDAQHLLVAGQCTLRHTGHEAHEASFSAYLRGVLLRPGEAEFSGLWTALMHDLRLPREEAGKVLALLTFYWQRRAQGDGQTMNVILPPPARQAMSMALEGIKDVDGEIARLALRIGEALAAQVAPEGTADAPAEAAPVEARGEAPRALEPPPSRPPRQTGSAPEVRAPPSSPQGAGARPGASRERRSFQALIAGVTLLGLVGYWGSYAFYRWRTVHRRVHVDPALLAAVAPVKEARVDRDTLVVVLSEDQFAKLGPDEQARTGRRLLATLARPGVKRVVVLSGGKQYHIERNPRSTRMAITPAAPVPQNPGQATRGATGPTPAAPGGARPGGARPGGARPGVARPGTTRPTPSLPATPATPEKK